MKNLVYLFMFLFIVVYSCKNDTKSGGEEANNKSRIELPKQKPVNSKKDNLKNIQLTIAQLEAFFPEYLGSNKRFNIFVVPGEPMATASYGSFESSYNYSLYDAIKDNSVIKNFEMSYNAKQIAPEGTEYIIKVRDGYKTMAFLQPKIKRYDIQFVYKNRFKIVLEGPEHSDVLWYYIKKSDLEKLDNY